MFSQKNNTVIRVIAFLVVMALIIPMDASALVQPRASDYLSSYNAYVYLPGTGEVRVYFNVEGTDYMDELGALSIAIYESTDGSNWTWKKTFTHDSTSGMLANNAWIHSGHVSYNGVAGRYYKAYVCIWGGKDGKGDTRYFYTSAKH
jgi:hypothetical protein